MGFRLVLGICCCAAAAAVLPCRADLTDTFDPPFANVTATQIGSMPGPTVLAGGPDGDFLRLANDGVTDQGNHYTYDRTDAGAFETIDVSFVFRIAGTNSIADGFHFTLVPTADYGTTGDGPNPMAEEPNWPRTFAVGFDVHPHGTANDVSLHWDGAEHLNDRVPFGVINLHSGVFHRAELNLRRVGNSSVAQLALTPDVFTASKPPHVAYLSVVPMMLPYESRVQFGARTGGSYADMDIDNLSVTVADPYTPIPDISTNRLFQDFDRAGCTPFVSWQHATTDLTWFRPGPVPQTDGDARGVYLRLVHDGVNTCRNSIAFDHVGASIASARRISFDFRMVSSGLAADGICLILLPTATHGQRGIGVDPLAFGPHNFEEPNVPGALALGFDLHPEDSGVNDVSLHWDGVEVTNVTVAPGAFDLNNAVWNRCELLMAHVTNGTTVTVLLYPDVDGAGGPPVTPIDSFFVEGLVPYEHRAEFGGRTGGRYVSVDLDNITAGPEPGDFAPSGGGTDQDFEGRGTPYEVWNAPGGNPWRAELLTDGPAGNYLRLVDDARQNHRNAIVFNQTAQGSGVRAGLTTVGQVDFRAVSSNTNDPADGFGFMLIPVGTYGQTGPGVGYQSGYVGVEQPSIPGVLAVGIDLHNEADGVNDVSLHWDGIQIQNVRLADGAIDLDAGVFHRVEWMIEWMGGSSSVSVTLTPDIHGNPGSPVEAIHTVVPGLTPYDFRVELAARTGGSTVDLDLDNIRVETVSPSRGSLILVR